MSIATEITRLQTTKADLKTAIEGKGVTVPAATKLDGYPALVTAISTGGGGSGQSGTYTPAEKTDTVVISVTGNPTHFVFAADEAYAGGNGSSFHMVYAIKNGITVGLRTNSAGTAYSSLTSSTTVTFGSGTITVYSPLSIGINPIPFSWAAW